MNKRIFILLLNVMLCGLLANAQEEAQQKSLQQRAEAEAAKGHVANARSLYINAFNDYSNKGMLKEAVECGTKATALYYNDNLYQEAFDFLRQVDQAIVAGEKDASKVAALRYQTTKERMQMYIKLRKSNSAMDQIEIMERHANASNEESLKNDLLYNKAIYYYTFGKNTEGNEVFKVMVTKLTTSKEYDKVDAVYQTLIANGRKSNSANLVAQSYKGYIAWKDSVTALKYADEIAGLKQQIANNETEIAEKDSSLSARMAIIIGLCVLAGILAAVLLIGGIVLMRFILLTRKQKKVIKLANDNNALKAKFIGNISAQLDPTLKKLDSRQPEVKSLMDFSEHIQTLSKLENSTDEDVEMEDIQIPAFCEGIMDTIRDKVKDEVTLTVNAPKMTAKINQEYVSHILKHLLMNAAEYTPAGGHIWLEYKKRGAHTHQFLVADTGCGIPEEKREDVFKAFLEIRDLTKGDGLGLPICKQMALKMNGDLDIDPQFTKGTRFVLDLHA